MYQVEIDEEKTFEITSEEDSQPEIPPQGGSALGSKNDGPQRGSLSATGSNNGS